MPEHTNSRLLEEVGGTWQAASVRGILASRGWGAAEGYPGLILDENGPEVPGFVFNSEQLAQHWERFDEFEGDDYERVVTVAKLDDERTIETYVYVLSKSNSIK